MYSSKRFVLEKWNCSVFAGLPRSYLFIRNVSILSSIKSKYIFKVAQQADFQIFPLAL